MMNGTDVLVDSILSQLQQSAVICKSSSELPPVRMGPGKAVIKPAMAAGDAAAAATDCSSLPQYSCDFKYLDDLYVAQM